MRERAVEENGPVLNPTLDFLRLLWSIEHGLQSTSKRMSRRLGITGPQRLVLRVVAASPGISAKELARVIHLHPSTITGILQRLVDKQLLVRARDPIDARRIRLRVQPSGRRFAKPSKGTVEWAVERALNRVPSEALTAARRVLTAIASALKTTGRQTDQPELVNGGWSAARRRSRRAAGVRP